LLKTWLAWLCDILIGGIQLPGIRPS